MSNNSIFEFAEKFGYANPFDTDWVAEGAEQRAEKSASAGAVASGTSSTNDIAITT